MNYYIIPNNNIPIQMNVKLTNEPNVPYISRNLFNHINVTFQKIQHLKESNDEKLIEFIQQIVNPFEFINTIVPGSLNSVSKINYDSILFFELTEIIEHFFISTNKFTSIISNHYESIQTMFTTVVGLKVDKNEIRSYLETSDKSDLIIYELEDIHTTDTEHYIQCMIDCLLVICRKQTNKGTTIIKLDYIYHKPIIDIVFILSNIFEKVYLVKPSIGNIAKGDRYLICKNFINYQSDSIINELTTIEQPIESIIDNPIPCVFLSKLEESNVVIGQQHLDAYNQVINIANNKNKDEKLDNMKRNHIQKCVQWCEKNQLPHNKFSDKVNIFLMNKI
jgi:hypothetical protein